MKPDENKYEIYPATTACAPTKCTTCDETLNPLEGHMCVIAQIDGPIAAQTCTVCGTESNEASKWAQIRTVNGLVRMCPECKERDR